MRRIATILLVIFIAFFVMLILYALPPTRPLIETYIGPPLANVGGGIIGTITSSWIWQEWFIPFPNQMIWGVVLLGLPMFWLFLKTRTSVRRVVFRGVQKESGYAVMTQPISSPTVTATVPTPTETKKEPAASPPPEAAAKVEEAAKALEESS